MTIHGKFIGRLIERPKRFGPKKYGFTTMALATIEGPDAKGVNTVKVLLDPESLDLVQLEGEVVKIGKCECCGDPVPIVDAFNCFRVTGAA
jgi:hypothetical protein